MELPIAPQTYRPTTDALVRAAKRASLVLGRTLADEQSLDEGTLLYSAERPDVAAANFAGEVTVPPQTTPREAVERIMSHYREHGLTCHALDAAETYWPDAVPPILSGLGYFPSNRMVCLLDAYQAPPAECQCEGLQIIPARASYGELWSFFMEMVVMQDRADAGHAEAVARASVDQLDEPRLEVFLGRLDGKAVGVCGVLTLGNMGVLYDLFTLPSARKRGVGAAMMAHTLDLCRRSQFEQVIASFPQNCPHLPFYQGLGFKVVGTFIRFRKRGG
jgi:GNAT superfamily N-acetyltransferase